MPRLSVWVWLIWEIGSVQPSCRNSLAQNNLQKQPRESRRGCRVTEHKPGKFQRVRRKAVHEYLQWPRLKASSADLS